LEKRSLDRWYGVGGPGEPKLDLEEILIEGKVKEED